MKSINAKILSIPTHGISLLQVNGSTSDIANIMLPTFNSLLWDLSFASVIVSILIPSKSYHTFNSLLWDLSFARHWRCSSKRRQHYGLSIPSYGICLLQAYCLCDWCDGECYSFQFPLMGFVFCKIVNKPFAGYKNFAFQFPLMGFVFCKEIVHYSFSVVTVDFQFPLMGFVFCKFQHL